jgi:hypothetical protein
MTDKTSVGRKAEGLDALYLENRIPKNLKVSKFAKTKITRHPRQVPCCRGRRDL